MSASLASVNELLNTHAALRARVILSQEKHRRTVSSLTSPPAVLVSLPLIPRALNDSEGAASMADDQSTPSIEEDDRSAFRPDLPPAKRQRALRYTHYSPEEETIRNDYSQRYVDGGEWPQNWVLGAEPEKRFEE